MPQTDDYLIFGPGDVDLTRSPLHGSLGAPTFVLGAFNPALTRLPTGNLLLMVRVAEALSAPVKDGHVHAIRWTPDGYVLDPHRLDRVDLTDPRFFLVRGTAYPTMGLTSLSWLLPVELTPDGRSIVAVHYDRAIQPRAAYQDYGIEDPRISLIDGRYYMTVCCCSAERHGTALYTSDDGLDWTLHGLVLDHQNKDMLLFEGLVGGKYWALTRPLGELYFAYPEASDHAGGPVIHFASSPDALHWKPCDTPGLRARRGSLSAMKVGGGTPPILTDAGWLMLYHGVEPRAKVGAYRTFWALLDRDDPSKLLRIEDDTPLLEADPALTAPIADRLYLPTPVVFTTGIVAAGDTYVVASGEADLACRITHIAQTRFA
jgi:predicted GH43/DUF377 family glycosyl hydrolase